MTMPDRAALAALALAVSPLVAGAQSHGDHRSPYGDLVDRPVKALSAEETSALFGGEGMGFALAAELNGVPGPKHVLELAAELGLDADQVARVEALRAAMSGEAVRLGRELVDAEVALDRAFAHGEAPPEHVRELIRAAGDLRTRLRETHLLAHLETARVLSDEQITLYGELRGYTHASPGDPGSWATSEPVRPPVRSSVTPRG